MDIDNKGSSSAGYNVNITNKSFIITLIMPRRYNNREFQYFFIRHFKILR